MAQELIWLTTKWTMQFNDTSPVNLLVSVHFSCASSRALNYFWHKTVFGRLVMPDTMIIKYQGIFQCL